MSPLETGLLIGLGIGIVWAFIEALTGRDEDDEILVLVDDEEWRDHVNSRFDRIENLACRNIGGGTAFGGSGGAVAHSGGWGGGGGGGAGAVSRISKQKIVVLLDRGEQTDAIAAARDADIVIVVSTMVPTGRVTKYRYGPHDDIDLVVVR